MRHIPAAPTLLVAYGQGCVYSIFEVKLASWTGDDYLDKSGRCFFFYRRLPAAERADNSVNTKSVSHIFNQLDMLVEHVRLQNHPYGDTLDLIMTFIEARAFCSRVYHQRVVLQFYLFNEHTKLIDVRCGFGLDGDVLLSLLLAVYGTLFDR